MKWGELHGRRMIDEMSQEVDYGDGVVRNDRSGPWAVNKKEDVDGMWT